MDPIIWAVVENAIGIVSASLPTLRPIYSLLVRGQQRSCERSPASPPAPASAATSTGKAQLRQPLASATSWSDEPKGRGEEWKSSFGSCDEGSLEKGGRDVY